MILPLTKMRVRMLVLPLLAASLLTGCTPEPEPTPTPTAAFASEDEAFAAAEEVYRAYNDALNAVDLGDPTTFEPLYELTSGDFEAADREAFSTFHAEGYSYVGSTKVVKFAGIDAIDPFHSVIALVCVDVSDSDVVDPSGASVTAPDRRDVNPLRVEFVTRNGELLIDRADLEESGPCAD